MNNEHATIAARQYLWMEALAACVCADVGIIAGFGEGPLWTALQHFAPWMGIAQNLWWGMTFIALATSLLLVVIFELKYGRVWGRLGILISADLRWILDVALAIVNVALILQLLWTETYSLWGIVITSAILAFFLGRATFITRRLSLALDRKSNTPGLERMIKEGL